MFLFEILHQLLSIVKCGAFFADTCILIHDEDAGSANFFNNDFEKFLKTMSKQQPGQQNEVHLLRIKEGDNAPINEFEVKVQF